MKKYMLSIACSFVFFPLMAWQSSLPRVGSVINIPSSVDYAGVTNVVTNVVTKGYVESLGIKADGEKIVKDFWCLEGDGTFGAKPVTKTNDFVFEEFSYTPLSNIYLLFGSYAPTNFVYKGCDNSTGIWECVYLMDGFWKTNAIKFAYDKMPREGCGYKTGVYTISGIETKESIRNLTFMSFYSPGGYQILNLHGLTRRDIVNLIQWNDAAGNTRYLIYRCENIESDSETTEILTKNDGLINSNFESDPKIGMTMYDYGSKSIKHYDANCWYKVTLVSGDLTKTNVFYTGSEGSYTNCNLGYIPSTGISTTTQLFGSNRSGNDLFYTAELIGWITRSEVIGNPILQVSTCLFLKNEFGDVIGVCTNSDSFCTQERCGDDKASWNSIDYARDDAYLEIATDRVKHGVEVAKNYADGKFREFSGNFLTITNDMDIDSVENSSVFIPTNSVWCANNSCRIFQQPFVEYCKYTNELYGIAINESQVLYNDSVHFNDQKYDLLFQDVSSDQTKLIALDCICANSGITSVGIKDISYFRFYAQIRLYQGKVTVRYLSPIYTWRHELSGYYTTNIVYDTYESYTNSTLFFPTGLKFENGFFGQGFLNQSFATISDLKKIPDIVEHKVMLYGCTGVSYIHALETYAANTNYPYGTYINGPDGEKYICTNDISVSSSWGVDSNCFIRSSLEGICAGLCNNVTITNELKQGTFVESLYDPDHYSDLIVVFKTKDVAYPFYLSGPNYITYDGGVTWVRDQRYSAVMETVGGTTTCTTRQSPLVFGSEDTHCIRTKPNTAYTVYVRYIEDFKVAVFVHEDVNLSTKDTKVTVREANSLITNTVTASYIRDTGIAASNETTHVWQNVYPVIVNGAVEWRVKE